MSYGDFKQAETVTWSGPMRTTDYEIRERAVELVISRGKRMQDDELSFYTCVKNMEEYLRSGTIPGRR